MEFSPTTRQLNIQRMKNNFFDLVVIGGGITGAGVAREAALRGLSAALVEKGDFASGTSSKSARMIHGGFRYLEQFQFGLVFKACCERNTLRNIAPLLIKPVDFVFPVYRGSRNSIAIISLGMWLYEGLALFRNLKRHRLAKPQEVKIKEPALEQSGLAGAIFYCDCLADDARLTLATIKAAHKEGAIVANYAEVVGLVKQGGRLIGVEILDKISGQSFIVRGKVVANTAGVWVDNLRKMDDPDSVPVIHANRGSHVVVPREKIPIHKAVIFTSPLEHRFMYAVPWDNTCIIGPTDLDHDGNLDLVYATGREVASILSSIKYVFPGANLTPDDVIATFAGLRPLISESDKTAYRVSRDHKIFDSPSGLVSIAGGKLTTYRKMAEDLLDHIACKLEKGHGYGLIPKSQSHKIPITDPNYPPLTEISLLTNRFPNMDSEILAHLVDTYGPQAIEILSLYKDHATLGNRILPEHPYIYAEVPFAIQNEMALTLSDFLIRRTHFIYEATDQGLRAVPDITATMAQYLGWDKTEKERQIEEYQRQVELAHAYRNEL